MISLYSRKGADLPQELPPELLNEVREYLAAQKPEFPQDVLNPNRTERPIIFIDEIDRFFCTSRGETKLAPQQKNALDYFFQAIAEGKR